MITVVSGQVSEGQILVMEMLQEGGMDLLTDATQNLFRPSGPDAFDYQPVRRLRQDNGWLFRAQDRALKVEAELLPFLNERYQYKVLFVERDLEDIIKSKLEMLSRLGSRTPVASAKLLAGSIALKNARIKNWLVKQKNIATLFIPYSKLLNFPTEQAFRINDFIGGWLKIPDMIASVEHRLDHKSAAVPYL